MSSSASRMSLATALPVPMPPAASNRPSGPSPNRICTPSGRARTTSDAAVSGRPEICSVSSYWSDQNQGTVANGSSAPSMLCAAAVPWSCALRQASSRMRRLS